MAELYHYHPLTGEYLHETKARLDPIDKTPMVPGNATLNIPPAAKAGKAPVFKNGAWSLVEDHRGKPYWLADGTEQTMQVPGPLPNGALTSKPVLPVYPDLQSARKVMVAEVDRFLAQVTGPVPDFERASWPSKAEAARAVLAGTARADQTNLIAAEAGVQTKTNAEVAQKIVSKADLFETIVAQATGLRVKIDDQLVAATDPMEYETILASGKTQAIALAQSHGITVS